MCGCAETVRYFLGNKKEDMVFGVLYLTTPLSQKVRATYLKASSLLDKGDQVCSGAAQEVAEEHLQFHGQLGGHVHEAAPAVQGWQRAPFCGHLL